MKKGVITDCFKLPLCDGLRLAGKLGFDGVQIYATTGEFSPACLDEEKKAKIKEILKEEKLEISALCADMGGYGFQIAEDNPERIEKTKRIIDLANEFECRVITTHIGVIPANESDPRYSVMLDAMLECAEYAKAKGVTLAIETGPEKADVLFGFLEKTDGGVGVNLDPANFVMVTDENPLYAVKKLSKYIVHTHAKDGKMLKKTDPEVIYDIFARGGIEELNVSDYFIETPLGEGDVNFPKYIDALKECGYAGYLTIERETGKDPCADIIKAKSVLDALA